jgi:excinuclease ABC subunit A
MKKPEVDFIEGLSPAISIDQKTTSKNPRSTVGTVTEIYDYLRLLYSRIGHPHCPICGSEISSQSQDEIVHSVLKLVSDLAKKKAVVRFLILSPLVNDKKGEFSSLFDNLKAKGFKQTRVDGYIKDLSEDLVLIKTNKHTIDVVIDKISIDSKNLKDKIFLDNLKSRLSDSIEQALKLSEGLIVLTEVLDKSYEMPDIPKKFKDHLFSEKFACPVDNINLPEIEPRTFSFNSPHGACPKCSGIGNILKVEPKLLFSEELTIREGGIIPFSNMFDHDTWYSRLIATVCSHHNIDTRIPIKNLKKEQIDTLLNGTGGKVYRVEGKNKKGHDTSIYWSFIGITKELERRHTGTESDWIRGEIEKYMRQTVCPQCKGAKLKKEALGITINDMSINKVADLSVDAGLEWFENLSRKKGLITKREAFIAKPVLNEIKSRLNFLSSVGLEYLTLSRTASTLSGGEAQRIRLASQIGSGLTGVLYVLDEPTIGLHQKDNAKLIDTLKRLRDLGNTVLVVEHDEAMMRKSDHIVDFGPGAGKEGGYVVVSGSLSKIKNNSNSITAKYLNKKKRVSIDRQKDLVNNGNKLKILGCSQFNLKSINVDFPLGKFVVIAGVSGSGKSTLLVETLYPALKQTLNPYFRYTPGKYKIIEGDENVDKVILIDQSPIGRTPRSNPATYTKVFDLIRDVFASTKDARSLGFKKGRFSFNVKGGRCEACEGQGQTKIEMQFMSDIWITCDVCQGKRYNAQTLEVEYKGKNISEILTMSVSEALDFFHIHPAIIKKLETLDRVGLSYIELGQSATTLSGGEAQRVKLATELAKKATGKTVYILDEPTTGLHFADIQKLLNVLRLLVRKGNSVFIIEHNMDVIKNADWIIDLGPGGGDAGGEVVATGTVNELAKNKKSFTGEVLQKHI